MEILEIIKVVCLFVTILFTIVNAARLYNKNSLPVANFLLHGIGLTGFIYLQWIAR